MGFSWPGLIALLLMLVAAATVGATVRAMRRSARIRATQLPSGAIARRVSRELPCRLTVERTIVGGPRAGGINRAPVDLVLTDRQLIAATWHGRILVIDHDHPGKITCTGPSRLVLEGTHPAGETRVRLEVLAEDADGWIQDTRSF